MESVEEKVFYTKEWLFGVCIKRYSDLIEE